MSPVLEERMHAAIGNARTCPHGHPIDVGERIVGVPLADVELGAAVTVLRFENEAEDLLHYLPRRRPGARPAGHGDALGQRAREVDFGGGHVSLLTRSVGRDGVRAGRSVAAAAHRAARAARPRPRPLRPLRHKLAALLAGAALTGCAAATSDGYSSTGADGWEDRTDTAETKSGVDYQRLRGPDRDGIVTTLIIDDAEPPRGAPPSSARPRSRPRRGGEAAPGARLGPHAPAELAGEPARRFDATLDGARLSEVVAVHAGRAYTVTITAAPAEHGRAVRELERVLSSWDWD
jgi:hypothetical protein